MAKFTAVDFEPTTPVGSYPSVTETKEEQQNAIEQLQRQVVELQEALNETRVQVDAP